MGLCDHDGTASGWPAEQSTPPCRSKQVAEYPIRPAAQGPSARLGGRLGRTQRGDLPATASSGSSSAARRGHCCNRHWAARTPPRSPGRQQHGPLSRCLQTSPRRASALLVPRGPRSQKQQGSHRPPASLAPNQTYGGSGAGRDLKQIFDPMSDPPAGRLLSRLRGHLAEERS